MMKKNFVLDTNVLLHDPLALFQFEDNNLIIPIYVIEEIDQFKKDLNELGRNARTISRELDELRSKGSLTDGVKLPNSGVLRVLATTRKPQDDLHLTGKLDNLIMAVALDLKEHEPAFPTVFVTKDINLRIKADALGLHSVDYSKEHLEISELYTGYRSITVAAELIDNFYRDQGLDLPDETFYPNEYLLLKDIAGGNKSALAKVSLPLKRIVPLPPLKGGIWGIRPRNKEQFFCLDALLNDHIKLVSLIGKAGTGKTLLALAAGLFKTAEEQIYNRLLVSRPIFPLGRDIGYLPGKVEDKLNPWMQPIYDNVDFLLGLSLKDKRKGRGYHELIDQGIMEIEPLTYIRGRSIPGQFMIIDEAQNLSPHEIKTILTRAGEGTKVVLTGDPYQIDNPYLDSISNGLAYSIEKFKGQDIVASVTLIKGERSPLAELASNLL